MGQTFTAGSSGLLDTVDAGLYESGQSGIPVTMSITTLDAAGHPDDSNVLATATVDVSALDHCCVGQLTRFTFTTPASVIAGHQYAYTVSSAATNLEAGTTGSTDTYSGGSRCVFDGLSWFCGQDYNSGDSEFITYVTAGTDMTAPTTSIGLTPSSPNGSNGWYTSAVGVTASATDPDDSVPQTRCALDPTSVPASFNDLPAGSCSLTSVATDGQHTIYAASSDSNGNRETPVSVSLKIDQTAPTVTCGSADGQWHASNVSIACTASDDGSGLATSGDASFSLSTSVPAGSETANASTNSHQVCDKAGNCATAGPISGNMIDRKPPSVDFTSPANGASYRLFSNVHANYSCTDGGSGVTSCVGAEPNGARLNTGLFALGRHTFTVTAKDNVGNTISVEHTYRVVL